MDTQTKIQQVAASLSQAIQHYAQLLKFLQEMDQEMGTADPAALQNFNASLLAFQEQAMQLDQNVSTQLNKKSLENESIQILIGEREALLKEILALNERMTVKASGIKSLIAHEIGKIGRAHV